MNSYKFTFIPVASGNFSISIKYSSSGDKGEMVLIMGRDLNMGKSRVTPLRNGIRIKVDFELC